MKMEEALKIFAFTDTSAIIDSENNVVGCGSDECGTMYCDGCIYTGCKANPGRVE